MRLGGSRSDYLLEFFSKVAKDEGKRRFFLENSAAGVAREGERYML
jgi:hypothetical protein